jgi:chromosome segregation protein
VFAARSAAERIELRLERTRETAEAIAERIERRGRQLDGLRAQAVEDTPDEAGRERIEALQASSTSRGAAPADALARWRRSRAARRPRREAGGRESGTGVRRRPHRAGPPRLGAARREAARGRAELASASQFLRTHRRSPAARSLADQLEVRPATGALAAGSAAG